MSAVQPFLQVTNLRRLFDVFRGAIPALGFGILFAAFGVAHAKAPAVQESAAPKGQEIRFESAPVFMGGPSDPLKGEAIEPRYLQAQGLLTPADLKVAAAKQGSGRDARFPRLFKDMYFDADVKAVDATFTYTFKSNQLPTLQVGDLLWHGDYGPGITVHRVLRLQRLNGHTLRVDTVVLQAKDLLKNMSFDLQKHLKNEPLPVFESMEYPDGRVEKWTSDDALLRVTRDPALRAMSNRPALGLALSSGTAPETAAYGGAETMDLALIDHGKVSATDAAPAPKDVDYMLFNGQNMATYNRDSYGNSLDMACASQLTIKARRLRLAYTPTLTFTFDTAGTRLMQANVQVSGTLDFKALLNVTSTGSCNLTYRAKPWKYSRLFFVYAVPMVAYIEVYPVVEASVGVSGWFQAGAQRQITHKIGYRFNQDAAGTYVPDLGWQGYKCPGPDGINGTADDTWLCSDTGFQQYNPYDATFNPKGSAGHKPTWAFNDHALAELRLEPHVGVLVSGASGPRIIPTASLRFDAKLSGTSSDPAPSYDYGLYGCFNAKFEFTFKGIWDDCSNSNGVKEEYYTGTELEKGSLLSKLTVPKPTPGAATAGNRSFRWTGMIEPRFAETYTFYANTTDGVRLWIGDGATEKALIDDWKPGALRERKATFTAAAGQKYSFKMEYFVATGSIPNAALWWSSTGETNNVKELIATGRFYPCAPYYTKTLYDNCFKLSFKKNGAEAPAAENNLDPTQGPVVVGKPDLIAPINGAFTGTLRPTFTWTAAANAQYYEIYIGNNVFTTTATTFTPPAGLDLRPQVQAIWKVRGYRSGVPQRFGMWSEERKVDIGMIISTANSFYGKLNVGNMVDVLDPRINAMRTFWLYDIDSNTSPRQIRMRYTDNGSWQDLIMAVNTAKGPDYFGTNFGLFVDVETIFDNPLGRFAYVMIAPYCRPQLKILSPTAGSVMSGAAVTVDPTYAGEGVPWRSDPVNPPRRTDAMKTLSYNGSTTTSETFNWLMSGAAGEKTMEVILTDILGATVTRSVTVSYDSAIPFWDFRGPLGDTWKGMSITLNGNPNGCSNSHPVVATFNYWTGSDPMGTHMGGSASGKNIEHMRSILADSIAWGALSQAVPTGTTTVFVVDKTQYDSGILSSPVPCVGGTITYKEIYNKLAVVLGKDSKGNYRVWTSQSGVRVPIKDAAPPVLAITSPSSGQITNSAALTVSGTASDDYLLSYVDVSINGGTTWTRATGTTTWSASVTLTTQGTNTVLVRATEGPGYGNKTTTIPVPVTYDSTPSTIIIQTPVQNTTVACATLLVAGTASDASGVSKVEVSVNGGPWIISDRTKSWGLRVNLAPGKNLITARAIDNVGNVSTATLGVTYTSGAVVSSNVPLPPPKTGTNSFGNEPALRDSNASTAATIGPGNGCAYGGGYYTGSAVYDLGTIGTYNVSANYGATVNPNPNGYGGSGSGTVSLAYSNDGNSWTNFASSTVNYNNSLGVNSVNGMFIGRYLKVTGQLYAAWCYPCENCVGIFYLYEVRLSLKASASLPLPKPGTNSFGNEAALADGDMSTAATIGPGNGCAYGGGYYTASAVYDFGSIGTYSVFGMYGATVNPNPYGYGGSGSGTVWLAYSNDGNTWTDFATSSVGYNNSLGVNSVFGTFTGKYLKVTGQLYASWCYPCANCVGIFYLYEMRIANGNSCIPALADMTPPALTITSPANGSVSSTSQVTLIGTAGADAVSPPGVGVSLNNGPFEPAAGTTAWSKTLTLTQGTNTLTVRAFDATGNMATATRTITYDNQGPAITITYPLNNSIALATPVTVSGTAADSTGIASVQVRVNGGTWATASGKSSWSSPVALVAGTNQIEVKATDTGGNQSITALNLSYASPQNAGLVGYWRLDQGSGTSAPDSSGYSNHGTLYGTGTTTPWVAGKVGNAMSFDGIDDYVYVNEIPLINGNAVTVSCWVNLQNATSQPFEFISTNAFILYVYNDPTQARVMMRARVGKGEAEYPQGSSPFSYNAWHHLVGVYDGQKIMNYVDGVLVASAPLTGSMSSAGFGLKINGRGLHKGKVDDVRIYNRAITPAEVRDLAALVGSWKFDEGSGTVAGDSSGNGNTGTLVNGPAWVVGKAGKALSFNGTSQYSTASGIALSGNARHTISAWIKVNALPPNRAWIALLGAEAAGAHHWLINSGGGTAFGIWNGTQVSPILPVGTWVHVAVSYDGTNLKCYTNGALTQTVAVGAQKFNLGGSFSLAQAHISENYFNGVVDDLRVYNRALTASEITAVKNGN